ncbi:hypothetical protein BC332_06684 [Capsicum chinense]|nr:hypothetical protein BC332_06684 [Capsicum chinense]
MDGDVDVLGPPIFSIQKGCVWMMLKVQIKSYYVDYYGDKRAGTDRTVEERYYKSFKFIPSRFPTVGGLSFVDSLLRKLNEMQLKSEVSVGSIMKPHICVLEKEFSSLTSTFRDVAKVYHQHEVLKDLHRSTINLAYEAEVAIDSILVQHNVLWIVMTTRLEKVGAHVMNHIDPYFLPFLTPEESCQLLEKKVFPQEGFPLELEDVSLAVAKRCKGLPLVVVLVAGIIKKKKMKESWWHEVKKSLLSYVGESEGYGLSTMKLSDDNLPDYLRLCLFYMGMFPEDARIPVSKLISQWIEEGFV